MYHSVSYVSKSKSECKTFVSVLRLQSYYVFFYAPNALNTFNNKVTVFCFTYYIRGLKGFVTFVYVCLHYVLRASCARTSLTHARTLYTQKTFSRCPGYLLPLHYLSPTLHYLSPNAALPIPNAALPLHICGGRQNPPDAPHRLARRGVNISIQIFFLSFLRIYSELREKIIKTNGNPHLLQTAVYYQK